MAESTWEKPISIEVTSGRKFGFQRLKFIVGGLLILGAVAYLILSGTVSGARYFITIDDLVSNPAYAGQTVRVSGAVLGDSIQYDTDTLTIHFTMSNIPQTTDNLAEVLHESVSDPNATRVDVVVENQPLPDLLKNEAQAIVTGTMGADGVFHATELLLKCPSRYQEANPGQQIAADSSGA